MRKMDKAETGRETANHLNQLKGGSIASRAIRFWGEEMGEL